MELVSKILEIDSISIIRGWCDERFGCMLYLYYTRGACCCLPQHMWLRGTVDKGRWSLVFCPGADQWWNSGRSHVFGQLLFSNVHVWVLWKGLEGIPYPCWSYWGVAGPLWTYILQMLSSNLGWGPRYSDSFFFFVILFSTGRRILGC
jgi:hypothetical protein